MPSIDLSQNAPFDANGVYMPTFAKAIGSVSMQDDFIAAFAYTKSANAGTSGNGTGIGVTAPAQHPGLAYAMTTATGAQSIQSGSSITISKAAARTLVWSCQFQIPTLSNATDRFVAYVGLFSNSSNTPFNGAYLKYSDNVNSGNWVLTAANSAVEVTTNSAVVATTYVVMDVYSLYMTGVSR